MKDLSKPEQKYYFVSFMESKFKEKFWEPKMACIDRHPLTYYRERYKHFFQNNYYYSISILSWQEISKEEYDKYLEPISHGHVPRIEGL